MPLKKAREIFCWVNNEAVNWYKSIPCPQMLKTFASNLVHTDICIEKQCISQIYFFGNGNLSKETKILILCHTVMKNPYKNAFHICWQESKLINSQTRKCGSEPKDRLSKRLNKDTKTPSGQWTEDERWLEMISKSVRSNKSPRRQFGKMLVPTAKHEICEKNHTIYA